MPIIITQREAAQISTKQKSVLRRTFHEPRFMRGQKIPVVLEVGGKAPFILEIIGIVEETVGDINDARAKEEGFRGRADWLDHWKKLYAGTNRISDETKVYAMRFRRSELVQKRYRQEGQSAQ